MRKHRRQSGDLQAVRCSQIRQIRGLSFVKVEFESKDYSILVEVDAKMLMQTKEFGQYFSVCKQEKSIHLTQSTDLKMYVIEEAEVECHRYGSIVGQANGLKAYETQVR